MVLKLVMINVMPTAYRLVFFLSLTIITALSQANQQNSTEQFNLASVFDGKISDAEWKVSGYDSDLFDGFRHGSAKIRISGLVQHTIFGQIENKNKLVINLKVYLGDATKGLQVTFSMGKYDSVGACWNGNQQVLYLYQSVLGQKVSSTFAKTTYYLNQTHFQLLMGTGKEVTSLVVTHAPSSFHFYFLLVFGTLLVRLITKYLCSWASIRQIRSFISIASLALLTGKVLSWLFILTVAVFTQIKWYSYPLPICSVIIGGVLGYTGISQFLNYITCRKEIRLFYLGVLLTFFLEGWVGSHLWYKIPTMFIMVPQIIVRYKQTSNIVHYSQAVITDFYILYSVCVFQSTLRNNFFRGEPSTFASFAVLTTAALQVKDELKEVIAMVIPRYRKRRFRIGENGVEELCSICLDSIERGHLVITPCNHGFHRICLVRWLQMNNMCPLDRSFLDIQEMRDQLRQIQ